MSRMEEQVTATSPFAVHVTVQAALHAKAQDLPTLLPRVQQLVLAWAQSKWPGRVPAQEVFTLQEPDVRIEAGPSPGPIEGWAFESRHQDHAGELREWVTECALVAQGDKLELALRNSAWLSPGARAPQPSVPRLLGELVAAHPWRDLGGFAVAAEPQTVQDESDLDRFLAHALAEDRTLPMAVMSESTRRLRSESAPFLPVPAGLAQQLAGVAHIVCVPRHMHRALLLELGPELTPSNGATRVLAPEFSLSDSARRHARVHPPEGAWAGELPALNWLKRTLVADVIGISAVSPKLNREVQRVLGDVRRSQALPPRSP